MFKTGDYVKLREDLSNYKFYNIKSYKIRAITSDNIVITYEPFIQNGSLTHMVHASNFTLDIKRIRTEKLKRIFDDSSW